MKPFTITPDDMPENVLHNLDDAFGFWSADGCIQELSKFNAKSFSKPIKLQFESEAHYNWFVLKWS